MHICVAGDKTEGAYFKYVTEGCRRTQRRAVLLLHLFQAENLCRFGQQVSDSDGSVLEVCDQGADLHVVRRCANFYVIGGGEWCISA